jgi:hypothetical protein
MFPDTSRDTREMSAAKPNCTPKVFAFDYRRENQLTRRGTPSQTTISKSDSAYGICVLLQA